MKIIFKVVSRQVRYAAIVGLLTTLVSSCIASNPFSKEIFPEFPDDPHMDRSLITGQPCDAPCWYGLKLGESNIFDIRSTLQNLQFVNHSGVLEQQINNIYPDQKLFIISCVYLTHEYDCGSLETSSDGKLERIYLTILYPLSIQSLVDKLGTPQYYDVFGPSPNLSGCLIYIYWPQKNTYIQINDEPGHELCERAKNGEIDLSLQIDAVRYEELNTQKLEDNSLPWSDIKP